MCKKSLLAFIIFFPFFWDCSHYGQSRLTVETIPPGAQVIVNGVSRGRSPLEATRVDAGRVGVQVDLEGYESAQSDLSVQPGTNHQVVFRLVPFQPYGNLSVESDPADAEWYLDGAHEGTTPDTRTEIPPGMHQVTIKAPGFMTWKSQVMVVRGQEATVRARLIAGGSDRGMLFVKTDPKDARVRILNIRPKFRQGMELKPGNYHLEVSAPGREAGKMWISLKAGEKKKLQFSLDDALAPAPQASDSVEPQLSPVAQDSRSTGSIWKEPTTGIELVYVPGGCYEMGCGGWTHDCASDELPLHEVCLDGFWLGKFEVTEKQWRQVMWSRARLQNGGDHPVKYVSWNDAKEFIRKLNEINAGPVTLRLPTEAEWEYACRSGGKADIYSGGEEVDQVSWYEGNSEATHRVGSKAPNSLGICDMSGNVNEWCEDLHNDTAYGSHSRNNPVNDKQGASRVIRGGSWISTPTQLRCADRGKRPPDTKNCYLGFRLAGSP